MLRSLQLSFLPARNLASIALGHSTMSPRKRTDVVVSADLLSPSAELLVSSAETEVIVQRRNLKRRVKIKEESQMIGSICSDVKPHLQASSPLSTRLVKKVTQQLTKPDVVLDDITRRLFDDSQSVKAELADVSAGARALDPESLADASLKREVVSSGVEGEWVSLGVGRGELDLSLTLPTGQTFRWRQSEDDTWTGVVRAHIVSLRQTPTDVLFCIHPPAPKLPSPPPTKRRKAGGSPADVTFRKDDVRPAVAPEEITTVESRLRDFLNLDRASLVDLYKGFSAADSRFAALSAHLGGARMLRQDPLECLFSFICSSNNHISRITGMVDHLSRYGDALGTVNGHTFHRFPTVQQLAAADEATLRATGFGYRAKYIEGTVKELLAKPGGGEQWLLALRGVPLDEAVEELVTLPGIGPKVARCIALFSLDKHECIPVDTHVWQLAIRYYTPELKGKSLTPRVHQAVADAFVKVFGPYAGWAHNILFIAELASTRNRLPVELHQQTAKKVQKVVKKIELVDDSLDPKAIGVVEIETVKVEVIRSASKSKHRRLEGKKHVQR